MCFITLCLEIHNHQHIRTRRCGLFQFRITSEIIHQFRRLAGLLARVINPSQDLCLHWTAKHAFCEIRARDPIPRGHWDHALNLKLEIVSWTVRTQHGAAGQVTHFAECRDKLQQRSNTMQSAYVVTVSYDDESTPSQNADKTASFLIFRHVWAATSEVVPHFEAHRLPNWVYIRHIFCANFNLNEFIDSSVFKTLSLWDSLSFKIYLRFPYPPHQILTF